MKTVGLFDKDSRIHYIDLDFVVINNPYNGGEPVIIMRHAGEPNLKDIELVLNKLNMKLVGEANYREDGLWYHQVKAKEVNPWMATNPS